MPRHSAYTNEYKEKCFVAWYANKRPSSAAKTREIIPVDEKGRKPNYPMLVKWLKDLEWHERADELDAKAMVLVDEALVNQKADMLKRQAIDAFAIANKAREFILEDGFDTAASAVNAYFKATEEERITRGIGDFVVKLSKMKDNEIQDEIIKLTNRAADSGQIILDAEEIEEDKTEDIPEEDDMTT